MKQLIQGCRQKETGELYKISFTSFRLDYTLFFVIKSMSMTLLWIKWTWLRPLTEKSQ